MKITRFADIPQNTRPSNYRITTDWKYIEEQLASYMEKGDGMAGLDLEPDFQRAHIWTESQQIAYVEYALKGGMSGRDIYFNCAGWQGDYRGPFVIVDGKQRLQAVRRFMRNEIPAFGSFYNEFTDSIRMAAATFNFHINNLPTMKDVLKWYLELNEGGTPHTEAETQKVKAMLSKS